MSEKEYKKLMRKLSKTKMERITHFPVIKQTIESADIMIGTPLHFFAVPYLMYVEPMMATYVMTYEDWEDYVLTKELIRKTKKEKKIKKDKP